MPLTTAGPGRPPSLLATSGSGSSVGVGYPEAFYAHNHKTPERSNRQKKPSSMMDDSSNSNAPARPAQVGRLRPEKFNIFTKAGTLASTGTGAASSTASVTSSSNANVGTSRRSPDDNSNISNNNNNNGPGNVGNGFDHIQQQLIRQQQPQQPPAAHFHDSNRSVASSTTASTAYASQATLAATIPSSHVNIITQAYGTKADIYQDILQIPRDMRSEREIRIAYFRRGRQVLAERSDPGSNSNNKVNSNVSQLAKMRFQAVSMAYEILSNPVWKESYDQHGLYGPDAFQEPAGSASMLAEDASLADPQVLAQNRDGHSHMPTDSTGGYNSTHSHSSGLDAGDTNRISPATSLDNGTSAPQQSQRRSKNNPVDMNDLQVVASENNMNGDNVSLVSQSTAGTTSTGGGYNGQGVLRKTGSFLEKLNKQKANMRKQAKLQQRNSSSSQYSNINNSGRRQHQQQQDSSDFPPPSSTVRWNEEVEELIFRQDPDEISFKAGTTTIPMETVSEQRSEQQTQNHRTVQQQQQEPEQQPQQPQHQEPQQQQQQQQGQFSGDHQNHENHQTYSEEPHQKAQTTPDAEQDYQPHAGASRLQRQDSYPNGAVGAPQGAFRSHVRDANGKQRVVLDTAELGSHLEKLDKVADSIADIFDELEASFDGLLGGFAEPKGGPTAGGVTSRRMLEAPTTAASDGRHQMRLGGQQPQGHAVVSDNSIAMGTPSVTDHLDQSTPADLQYDESSYHTPPISIGSTSRMSAVEQQQGGTSELLATEQAMTRLEALQVEEQAMALLREISACESVPPPDVVVKTKKTKHSSHHSLPGDMATLVEVSQETSPTNEPQNHLLRFEGGETYSACASDMAYGGENTTVATTSVVSLLDAEKHSNAPLKPAATTSTTGAKASRKRLKNVQRRRQQQRAREQQQEEEELSQRWDPSPALQENVGLSVRDRTTKWNQLANPSAEDSQKPKKPPKKKNTEDQYFESLYQNFFALPKERLPNEMTVKTRPDRSSCSVSTLSHSVATTQEPAVKLDFDPWGLGSGAWPSLGDANDDKERRSKHHKDVMARVDEMLVDRSAASNLDMTFDSSLQDTSFDSATAVDTSFGSSAVDTAFTSALDHRKSGNFAAAAITGCEGGPSAVFLNTVFNVPLEAPLDYFCGEAKDCASSTKGKKRVIFSAKPDKKQKPMKSKAKAKAQDPSGSVSSQEEGSTLQPEEEDGPPTDESITLLDPPTHDSRIRMSRSDDSTLNTLNTNNVDEPAGYRRQSRPIDPSTSPSPSVEESRSRDMTDGGSDPEEVNERVRSPHEFVKVETASYSQFFEDESSGNDASGELDDIVSGTMTTPATSEGEEERDGNASDDNHVQRFTPENQVPESSDSGSTMEAIPAPSSLTGKRIEIDSEMPGEDQAFVDEDGMESCAASVASTAVSSTQGAKKSNLITYLMKHLKKATAENPSLSCMKANIHNGLEAWRESNQSCMDAIVISDEDMSGMLDIIQKEMMWPPPEVPE